MSKQPQPSPGRVPTTVGLQNRHTDKRYHQQHCTTEELCRKVSLWEKTEKRIVEWEGKEMEWEGKEMEEGGESKGRGRGEEW